MEEFIANLICISSQTTIRTETIPIALLCIFGFINSTLGFDFSIASSFGFNKRESCLITLKSTTSIPEHNHYYLLPEGVHSRHILVNHLHLLVNSDNPYKWYTGNTSWGKSSEGLILSCTVSHRAMILPHNSNRILVSDSASDQLHL